MADPLVTQNEDLVRQHQLTSLETSAAPAGDLSSRIIQEVIVQNELQAHSGGSEEEALGRGAGSAGSRGGRMASSTAGWSGGPSRSEGDELHLHLTSRDINNGIETLVQKYWTDFFLSSCLHVLQAQIA